MQVTFARFVLLGMIALTIIAFRKSRRPLPEAISLDASKALADDDERTERNKQLLAAFNTERRKRAAEKRRWWARVATVSLSVSVLLVLAIQDKEQAKPIATPLPAERRQEPEVEIVSSDAVRTTPLEERIEYSKRYQQLKINMHESEAVYLVLGSDYMSELGSTVAGSGEYKMLRWDLRDGSAIELTFKDGYLVRKTQRGL